MLALGRIGPPIHMLVTGGEDWTKSTSWRKIKHDIMTIDNTQNRYNLENSF